MHIPGPVTPESESISGGFERWSIGEGPLRAQLLGPVLVLDTLVSAEAILWPNASWSLVDAEDGWWVQNKCVAPDGVEVLAGSRRSSEFCTVRVCLSAWSLSVRHRPSHGRHLASSSHSVSALAHLLMGVAVDHYRKAHSHTACLARSHTPLAALVRRGYSIHKWLMFHAGFFPAFSQVGEASGIPGHGRC